MTVEVVTEKFEADATVITGTERDALYARQVAVRPVFAEYEQRTSRKIPVVALERLVADARRATAATATRFRPAEQSSRRDWSVGHA